MSTTNITGDLETRAEAEEVGGEAAYWSDMIDLALEDRKDWDKDGAEVQERYKRKPRQFSTIKSFNILYSNTEVLKGALFAKMAKPDVRRRFRDKDAKGRVAAEVIERAIVYVNDVGEPEKAVKAALEDYLLPGRGVIRVCFESTLATHPETGAEYVKSQELWDEYVPWNDLLVEPCINWARVTWIAFRRKMSRDDLHKNFDQSIGAEQVNVIPLNWMPKMTGKRKVPEAFKKAEVWEIWDKTTKTRIWIVQGYDKTCRKDEDPLGLEDFWPIPEPIQATTTNDTYIPQPEFLSYRDQADSLDEIESRIDRLTKTLKRRGAYNANMPELKKIGKLADNDFIGVQKWDELRAGGGLKAAYEVEDIAPTAQILQQLHEQRDLRIQSIYEIMGIADIMRGSTNPNETLGAQQLKAQFGSNRLKRRQDEVQAWIRGSIRLKAEIIAEHFEPEKLSEISGFPWVPNAQPGPDGQMVTMDPNTGQPVPVPDDAITPDIIQMLRTDRLRCYRIDIETDSTIYEDAEAEKQSRIELLTAMGQFMTTWAPIVQGDPTLLPLAFELLAFGVRGFKTGRQVEEMLEQTQMQLQEAAKQREQQPPQPTPEEQAAQQQQQADQQKAQVEAHKAELKAQTDAQKTQADQQTKAHQAEISALLEKHKADLAAANNNAKLQQEDRHHSQKLALERERMMGDHKVKIAAHNKAMLEEANDSVNGAAEEGKEEDADEGVTQNPIAAILERMDETSFALASGLEMLAKGQKAVQEKYAEGDAKREQTQLELLAKLTEVAKAAAAPKDVKFIRDSSGRAVGGRATPILN